MVLISLDGILILLIRRVPEHVPRGAVVESVRSTGFLAGQSCPLLVLQALAPCKQGFLLSMIFAVSVARETTRSPTTNYLERCRCIPGVDPAELQWPVSDSGSDPKVSLKCWLPLFVISLGIPFYFIII